MSHVAIAIRKVIILVENLIALTFFETLCKNLSSYNFISNLYHSLLFFANVVRRRLLRCVQAKVVKARELGGSTHLPCYGKLDA